MASPPPSRRRRRRRRMEPAPGPPEARDWSVLPLDVLFAVFLRLGPREIMRGADRACTAWRRAAVGEPALWRRVDLTAVPEWKAMARAAVDRAAGQCEAYRGPCDNDFLLYLVERATSLKSIHLSHDEARVELNVKQLNKLPLLEVVDISLTHFSNGASRRLFESVCRACPRLKELRMCFSLNRDSKYYDGDLIGFYQEKYAIPVMCELRSLELLGYYLTVAGLTAILDSCPVLESLNVPGGDYLITSRMDDKLRAKCAKLKNVTLSFDSSDEESCEEEEECDLEDGYESESYDYPLY